MDLSIIANALIWIAAAAIHLLASVLALVVGITLWRRQEKRRFYLVLAVGIFAFAGLINSTINIIFGLLEVLAS